MSGLLDESDDDPLNFDETIERSWRVYMRAFMTEVYPMFKEHDLSVGDALIIWELNRMKNAINRLADEKEDGA